MWWGGGGAEREMLGKTLGRWVIIGIEGRGWRSGVPDTHWHWRLSQRSKTPLGWILHSSTYTDKAWFWFKSSWTTVIPKQWSNTRSDDTRKAWTLNCLPHPTPCQTRLRCLLFVCLFVCLICFVSFQGMHAQFCLLACCGHLEISWVSSPENVMN